jgi:hypothetical protein
VFRVLGYLYKVLLHIFQRYAFVFYFMSLRPEIIIECIFHKFYLVCMNSSKYLSFVLDLLRAWIFVTFVVCCVGNDLCDELIIRSEESYRACVSSGVRSRNLKSEAAWTSVGLLRHRKKNLVQFFFVNEIGIK